MTADYHMHTSFSTDAQYAPEEMIKGAIQKGLRTICITDHMDIDFSDNPDEFTFDTERYFTALQPLREQYQSVIDVRIGVETGLQPHLGEALRRYVNRYPFDFVIGSVHLIQGQDPYNGTLFQEYSDEEAYRLAFEDTLVNLRHHADFDVLGHLDYVVRYGRKQAESYAYRTYTDQIDEILKMLIAGGKGIEVNTAGLKYGLGFAHPYPDILKRYRELGGEILTIGSDAHKPEHIAYDFRKAEDVLKQCGFRYYTLFKERKPVFEALNS